MCHKSNGMLSLYQTITNKNIMKAITRQEFRNLESKEIQSYSWYIKEATLQQEVALYERITRDLKKIYQIVK